MTKDQFKQFVEAWALGNTNSKCYWPYGGIEKFDKRLANMREVMEQLSTDYWTTYKQIEEYCKARHEESAWPAREVAYAQTED